MQVKVSINFGPTITGPDNGTLIVTADPGDYLRSCAQLLKPGGLMIVATLNRTLKAGLQAGGARPRKQPIYGERTYSMGAPRVALDKALALAATLEDEEIVRELALRK